MKFNKNELYSGGLMMLIGIGTTVGSLEYRTGTLARMGPGYFPLMLGVALTIIAILILASPSKQSAAEEAAAAQATESGEEIKQPWRAPICVVLSVVLFITLGKYGGLVPATFAVVLVSALGDPDNSFVTAAVAALVVTLFAIAVFHYGLRMQFPLFTWG